MLVIGFGHRARQGKNTVADYILEKCPLGMQVRQYAFADALRMEVRVACAKMGGQYNLIESFKEGGIMPEWVHFEEPKPRSLLQWWGTEYRRAKDQDYWIKALRKTLNDHKPELALITDVRFPNEVDLVHELGGLAVKVIRTTAPDVAVQEHVSESVLDGYTGWDFRIAAADLPDLKKQADKLWERINEQILVS